MRFLHISEEAGGQCLHVEATLKTTAMYQKSNIKDTDGPKDSEDELPQRNLVNNPTTCHITDRWPFCQRIKNRTISMAVIYTIS